MTQPKGLPSTIPFWESNTPLADDALPGLPRLAIYLPSPEYRTTKGFSFAPQADTA